MDAGEIQRVYITLEPSNRTHCHMYVMAQQHLKPPKCAGGEAVTKFSSGAFPLRGTALPLLNNITIPTNKTR